MPDNKNNMNCNGNKSVVTNDGVKSYEKGNHLAHSLKPDSGDYAPPPVSRLNGNTANSNGNNNENK